jgi:hypothetical protein
VLQIVGLGDRQVQGTGTAEVQHGVTTGEP